MNGTATSPQTEKKRPERPPVAARPIDILPHPDLTAWLMVSSHAARRNHADANKKLQPLNAKGE